MAEQAIDPPQPLLEVLATGVKDMLVDYQVRHHYYLGNKSLIEQLAVTFAFPPSTLKLSERRMSIEIIACARGQIDTTSLEQSPPNNPATHHRLGQRMMWAGSYHYLPTSLQASASAVPGAESSA